VNLNLISPPPFSAWAWVVGSGFSKCKLHGAKRSAPSHQNQIDSPPIRNGTDFSDRPQSIYNDDNRQMETRVPVSEQQGEIEGRGCSASEAKG